MKKLRKRKAGRRRSRKGRRRSVKRKEMKTKNERERETITGIQRNRRKKTIFRRGKRRKREKDEKEQEEGETEGRGGRRTVRKLEETEGRQERVEASEGKGEGKQGRRVKTSAMDPPSSTQASSDSKTMVTVMSQAVNATTTSSTQSLQVSTASANTPAVSLQIRPQLISTFGFRLANNAVAVQVPNSTTQNIQVARGTGLPIVSSSLGASGHFTLQPAKIPHTGFPAAIVGQQLTLQRLPAKGQPIAIQRLASGTVLPLTSPQVVGLQRPTTSPGKIIPLRQLNPQPLVTGQHRLIGPTSSVSQKPLSSSPATIIAVSQPQQMAVRIPQQQSSLQRVNSPMLGSVQVPMATQPNYIHCVPNAGSVSHSFMSGTGGVRTQATIVGSQALLPGHQIVQPRLPNLISAPTSAAASELTLTVTNITTSPTLTTSVTQSCLSTSINGSSVSSTVLNCPTVPLPNVVRANVPVIARSRGVQLQGSPATQLVRPVRQINPEHHTLVAPLTQQKAEQEQATQSQVSVSVPLLITSTQPPSNTPVSDTLTVAVSQSVHKKTSDHGSKVTKDEMTAKTREESAPSISTLSDMKTISNGVQKKPEPVTSPGQAQVVKLSTGSDSSSQIVITVTKNSATGIPIPHLIGVDSGVRKQPTLVNVDVPSVTATSLNSCNESSVTASSASVLVSTGTNITKLGQASNGGADQTKELVREELKSDLTKDAVSASEDPSGKTETTEAGDILTDGFIDSNLLEWDNGVGTLCGTNMKFKINEFGDLELMEDGFVDVEESISVEPGGTVELKLENSAEMVVCEKPDESHTTKLTVTDPSELSEHEDDSVCCCVYCGNYGYKSNFKSSGKFCSQTCADKRKQHISTMMPLLLNKKEPLYEKKPVSGFDWDTYLAETGTIGAPRRLFKEPFPTSRNGFRIGMRLEGVDPKHQSLFCVLSVAEVQGFRLRLHFDGYSECYDFWVTPSAFRVGMKLEAVDKRNQSLIGVATVADTLGEKVLIHFDGWEDNYDYWCDITSPNIHPVGWCASNNHSLTSPPDFGDTFSWDRYLADTHSTAVPVRAFKTRPLIGFEHGMKVELVDKRNPILLRVASIVNVQSFRLLMHFDGWDSIYDYWIDEDNPDLHPPHWCEKTGHLLQPPINKKLLKQQSDGGGCPTLGCSGIGHIKGARYTGHHSAFGCPYSDTNMSKESTLTDRLGSSRSEETGGVLIRHDSAGDIKRCPTIGCDGLGHVTGKFTSHHCLSGCPLAEKNQVKIKQEGHESRPVGRPGRGRKRKIFSSSKFHPAEKVIKTEPIEESNELTDLCASVHESVFQNNVPPPAYSDGVERSLHWEQHTRLLPGVEGLVASKVAQWSASQVAQFIQTVTGQEDQASKFLEQEVDGDSLLLLQQSDLLNFLHIKLGPAVKIFNSILAVRATAQQM
ncbi:lethal(3)malignant brain tumor-like 4 protein [Elysia marginata]|uniref:Lethal(3)malignant brain tumor-like 4 protein n=1 Tax=Elysia marginata TaxID=1093978 RepID=A0AAV4INF9_9GAST|nr:lethal(3)malignant brain tumor-like 4 protein [Elysia marginata]